MVHLKYRILILSFDSVVGSVSRACVSLAGLEHAIETRLASNSQRLACLCICFLRAGVIWIVWLLLLLVRCFFFFLNHIHTVLKNGKEFRKMKNCQGQLYVKLLFKLFLKLT